MAKYTKWTPLHAYTTRYNSYLIQARRHIKSGLICFKTIKIATDSHFISLGLNSKDQFKLLETYD